MAHSRILATAAGGGIALGRFRCPPDDPAWRERNAVSATGVLAFAHRAVGIRMEGRHDVVADPNRVMLYHPSATYERHLIDPDGDRCTYIAISPRLLETLPAETLVRRAGTPRFVTDHLTVHPGQVLRLRVLSEEARLGRTDALTIEEGLLGLAMAVLGVVPPTPDGRPATRRAHRLLVEDAREWIAGRAEDAWLLDDLADALHTAPAHLHRVFRAMTGTTVHEHRDRLRLARALDLVLGGAEDLAAVALDVGYSSHSHFTRRFRRLYGATPSQVRDDPVTIVIAAA